MWVDQKAVKGTVLVLNGCNGPQAASFHTWASYVSELGYHAILVDSFTSRGHTFICGTEHATSYPSGAGKDARAVGQWVKQQPWSNGKVVLLGFSLGGGAALYGNTTLRQGTESVFAGAIAYYPPCAMISEASQVLAPMQVHIGTVDEWTPAKDCLDLARARSFKDVEFFFYEGAHHAFDWHVTGAFKCFWGPNCTVMPHRQAAALARERVKRFLAQTLG